MEQQLTVHIILALIRREIVINYMSWSRNIQDVPQIMLIIVYLALIEFLVILWLTFNLNGGRQTDILL